MSTLLPTWLLTDAAPYFVSSELTDFCSRSGVGLLTAPAEAHWLMGHEERRIQTLKRTAAKLEREGLGISIEEVFSLAAHGANSSVNASGFSPFQWTRGWQKDEVESLPEGVRPKPGVRQNSGLEGKGQGGFREIGRRRAPVSPQQLRSTTCRAVCPWHIDHVVEAEIETGPRVMGWPAPPFGPGRIHRCGLPQGRR